MLEATTAIDYLPGVAASGAAAGARWRFALPDPAPHRVIVSGPISAAARRVLLAAGARIVRVDGRRPEEGVTAMAARDIPPSWANLIVTDDAEHPGGLREHLAPGGMLLARRAREGAAWWVAPARGEPAVVAPADDAAAIAFLIARGDATLHRFPRAQRAARLLRRRLSGPKTPPPERPRARGTTLRAICAEAGPPAYVRAAARDAGISLDGMRWAVSAAGEAPHQKVLVWLFPADGSLPTAVVKVARVPSMSARVRTGFDALVRLAPPGFADGERAPLPLFAGDRGGLALAAESVIEGRPFRSVTRGTPWCPAARAAIDSLLDLGACSLLPPDGTAGPALRALLERFEQLYEPAAEHVRFLARQIDSLEELGLPSVFMHGDPGTWNVLVLPSGRAGLVDWEASDPAGPPLWDVFYLVRSIGVWASRMRGIRRPLDAFTHAFLGEGGFAAFLVSATREACRQLDLDPRAVEPLWHTCWMHRALREAMARPPQQLARANYAALSRFCIEQRDGFEDLFEITSIDGGRRITS